MRHDHRGMPYRIVLALLVVTSVGAAGTQELEDYCARAEKFGFSGSVLVAKGGKILLQKGYGRADREQAIANTEHTLFEIASATKPFTAAAILKLEEQGKLSTDDAIAKHLPGVPPHRPILLNPRKRPLAQAANRDERGLVVVASRR